MQIQCSVERRDFHAAAILVKDIEVRESGEAPRRRLDELKEDLAAGRAGGSEETRLAVRNILRNGKYRPSGRAKPAQEYLLRIWSQRGELDLINNAVDVNNIISLRYGLPISAFDAQKLSGDLEIRLGKPGERYVFNASGQELDSADLIVVCDERGPVGSPVKDSQGTKLFEGAHGVLYIVYASFETTKSAELLTIARELGALLVEDCPEARAEDPQLIVRGA